MHELTLLQDMAIVMAISAAVMIVCRRFRLPVVVGYILAGIIIGPYTPPFPLISDLTNIRTLSELGVIFLLFGIGLEFSLSKLLRVGLVSFLAATLEIVLMVWAGFAAGRAFGWSAMDSLFLGAILSISSTTIIAKVLLETGKLEEEYAHVILGILIIEDVLAIIIIALLSGFAATGALTFEAAGAATVRVGSFVAGTLLVGLWLVPRLLRYLERFQSRELAVITVLGLCFGAALAAAKLGFSVALGAFLMGAIIAETPQAAGVIQRMEPIRDMFTAIFFVSVGMLFDPAVLVRYAWPVLAITLLTVVGKVASCTLATFVTGYRSETALRVGLGLAQIGEFSFIIARLGERTQATSAFLYPIAVTVSGLTALTTPLLMTHADRIVGALKRVTPKPLVTLGSLYHAWLERLAQIRAGSERQRAIWDGLRIQLPRLALYIGATFGLVLAANRLAPAITVPAGLYWGIVGVATFPLVFATAYTLDRIVWESIVLQLMPPGDDGLLAGQAGEVLHNLIRFLTVLICGVSLLLAVSFFMPAMSLSVGIVGLVAVASLVLWDSARRFHERMERTVLEVFEREQPAEDAAFKRSRDELVQLIRDEYPWDVETQDVVLPFQESAVNQPLRALRVRADTGATVVAIYRGSDQLVNPSPDVVLAPGDVVLLMGSPEQVEAGVRLLQEKMHAPSVTSDRPGQAGTARTVRFEVPASSRWVGRTVADLNLRRVTEAHVVGVQKADRAITNPEGSVRIDAGDTLVLFGRSDQLARAMAYLSATNGPETHAAG